MLKLLHTLKNFFSSSVNKLQNLLVGIEMPTYKNVFFLLSVMSNFFFLLRIQKLSSHIEKLTSDNQYLREKMEALLDKVNIFLVEKTAKKNIDSIPNSKQEPANQVVPSSDDQMFSAISEAIVQNGDYILWTLVFVVLCSFTYYYGKDISFRGSDTNNITNSDVNLSAKQRDELLDSVLETMFPEGNFGKKS